MSTAPDPSPGPDEALSRMAAYGRQERARSSWGPMVLILVLLIPLAAVAWTAWRQMELQNQLALLRADNVALQQLVASSSGQFAQVEQRQQELDTALQQTLQEELAASSTAAAAQAESLARLERGLTALEAEIARTQLRANEAEVGGAPLAEAEALLRLAQQRLVLAHDTSTAAELLLAADELLRKVDDPGVFAVRETLAREMAALQAVPAIDVAGLFAQLSAQSARVENFMVVADGSVQDFSVTPVPVDASAEGGWWSGIKQAFDDYFVVTQDTGEILPQMSAAEQFQLRALVQLKIEYAKLALLQGEQQLYKAALDDALSTARRWLRDSAGSVEEFAAALERLRDTPIVADIPPTGQTLAALQALSGTSAAPMPNEAPATAREDQP